MTARTACIMLMLFLALPLAGCQRDEEGPLSISGKVFVFNYRVAKATYLLTLARNGALPDESYAEATFENPTGGEPLKIREKIFPFWDKVTLESPAVHCVRKEHPYAVSIRIIDATGKLLQSIDTTVISSMDQSVMPAKPLVVGPVYTENPEVFKADGTMDFSPEKGCDYGDKQG
ncbi:hypothetical protein NBH19_05170 [Rhizobium sp. S95]|uniref:DUF3304 domain-containing protein n=1 Tax=Ciceribacter sichuanensis TaxID=2949647 RepID=A0AAJ1BT54_9HYPH|nr:MULTISPECIES: hypothetical protein [unclassified Ciceribacter]MCM2395478.1 hypothetical protein [Ciceribacter sp. S95]MCO5955900.1 hypothetical protein [Ciceribacter sp. S101]